MADNLLDKASILLTPTAYDNGSMLSIKPENGDGDFDFSRSSAATRVNAQGLVENVQIISSELVSNGNFSQIGTEEVLNGNFSQEGSELVTNGDFATDSDWVKDSGWSIQNGQAICNGLGVNSLQQSGITTVGKIYKLSFDVLDSSDFDFLIISTNFGDTYVDADLNSAVVLGRNTFYIKPTNGTGIRFRVGDGTTLTIDNVSVKEVGENWDLGTGWSIGENKAICDGTQTGWSILQQNNILPPDGSIVKIVATVSNYSSGNLYLKAGFSDTGFEISSNGTFTTYRVVNGSSQFRVQADLNFIGSITNISVKEVGQDWSLGDGWTISNLGATCSDLNNNLTQDVGVTAGKSYKVTLDITDYTSGTLAIDIGGSANQTATSLGSKTFYFTTTSTGLLRFYGGAFRGTITNISVKEITDDTDIPRINYSGFSYQDSLGSEEVVNGDFSNGSANWTVQSGTVNITDKAEFVGSSILRTSSSILTSGKEYKITYEITSITGSPVLKLYDGTWFTVPSTVGTHTVYRTINSVTFYLRNDSSDDITIDNVSVKEYLGQEVVPDSGCGSWLLEPQSTNTVTYSEDFSQWSNVSTTLTSSYLAPDGTLGATKISGTIGTSYIALGSTSSQTATRTIWARTVSGTGTAKLMSYYQNTNNLFTLTEKWQRFELNGAIATGGTSFYVDFRDNSQTLNEFIIWGAQAEALSYATSYIPTNGATNTRLQDIANNSGNSSLINSTEGVLYAEIAAFDDISSLKMITLQSADNNNKVSIGYANATDGVRVIIRANGSNIVNQNFTASNLTDFNKLAFKYESGASSIYLNGSEVLDLSSANFTFSQELSKLSFDGGNTANPFYGKVKALAVYKEALTDAELQSLTTI